MPIDPADLIEEFHRGLLVDEEWTHREPGGFTWWPSRVRQVVRAYPPVLDHGERITRVVAEVPLLRDVTNPDAALFASLANMTSVGTGVVLDVAAGTLRKRLTASLWDGNRGWLSKLALQAAALQATMIDPDGLETLAEAFGGTPDVEPHPVSGPRDVPDGLTELPQTYAAAGAQTVITTGEITELVAFARPHVHLRAEGRSASTRIDGAVTGRWTLESTRHPELGWGLVSLVTMAAGLDLADGARRACELNVADSALEHAMSHFLGGWCGTPEGSLVHHTFIPEMAYAREPKANRQARMQNLLADALGRIRWSSGWLADVDRPSKLH